MGYRLTKGVLLGVLLAGLCLSGQANTTAAGGVPAVSAAAAPTMPPLRLAQTDLAVPPFSYLPDTLSAPEVRVALVLPLQSEPLGPAAQAVRAGFMAAYEREPDGVAVAVIETGDAAQDVLIGYDEAVSQHDIVVGPLSRSGVAAVVQSNAVIKPTIALTQMEAVTDSDMGVPSQLLGIGLSLEDEARQAALWALTDKRATRAIVLFTPAAWQRRAASAFAAQWQKQGAALQSVELNAGSGYLTVKALADLKKMLETEKDVLLFAALDARQARQVRQAVGRDVPMYGTSQLNPYVPDNLNPPERMAELEGARLIDIPWQLQRDHPAVMIYPRPVTAPDQQPNADLERLYALGIDAYRIAREVAQKRASFQLDGVTGKLEVRFGQSAPYFQRTEQQAVYRDGLVTPLARSR